MIITVLKAIIDVAAGWAVGAADNGTDGIDRELLLDVHGHPWVPPSSLAGSLRAHLADNGADERLMGSRPPIQRPAWSAAPPPKLNPSALWLLGTQTRRAGDDGISRPPATTVDANTAIDPRRGAARPKSLRHSLVVDEPTVVELFAQFEGELTTGDLELLASWQPQVGRDRTRGGGSARLRSLGYQAYDLNRDADLRAWLDSPGMGRFSDLTDVTVNAKPGIVLIDDEFEVVDALHIGTGSRPDRAAGRGRDRLAGSRREKVSVVRTRGGQPLVPGSTWKGIFRARCGYIMRTCWGEKAVCTDQTGCGTCPLCELFGSTAGRGLIAFGSSAITGAKCPDRSHVAIDRITGGARDYLLFTDEIVTSGTMKLTISALGAVADWQRDLLRHVERDIHDGLIGIGGGTHRGQGTLRLTAAYQESVTGLRPIPATHPGQETDLASKGADR